MGIYINVPDKAAWLKSACQLQLKNVPANPKAAFKAAKDEGAVLLAVGAGPAPGGIIAVLYSAAETERFALGRPDMHWLLANKAAVLAACPEAAEALK